jgi:hypothetical protein
MKKKLQNLILKQRLIHTELNTKMPSKDYKYDHGLPFSESLVLNIDDIKKRIYSKKAAMIIFDGQQGEGKTTLAIEVLEYYQGSKIDYKIQYAMGGEDFQHKLRMCIKEHKSVIIYDEGGDFNSRGALTKFNRQLTRIFETFRTFQILVIIVLPLFNVLDKGLFEKGIPRLLVNCHNRSNVQGNFRGYGLYRMYYLIQKMKIYTVPQQAYSHTLPNFRGHFLDLPESRSKQLDRISSEGKISILDKSILATSNLISINDIQRQTLKSKAWIYKKLSEYKIKPDKVIGKKNYYPQSIVKIIGG